MVLEDRYDNHIFDWLGEGLESSSAYLRLLRPGHDEWSKLVLANLKKVAARLRDQPEEWGRLIRERNWRFTLIGSSAVLLARDERFLGPLLDSFREGSWVAPQLAVALGLIHPDRVVEGFEQILRQASDSTDFKRTFSAYAVLKRLGMESAQEFESSELFVGIQSVSPEFLHAKYGSEIALNVVQGQWNFWSSLARD